MTQRTTPAAQVLETDLEEIRTHARGSLDRLAGMRVLMTGGAGFLGYEMLHVLATIGEGDGRAPVQLTVYDNMLRGRKAWLEQLGARPHVQVVNHDITKPLPADAPAFDYIVHAASIASPIFYRQYPIETIDANVNGVRHLLDHMRARQEKNPVRGMLFFSSSEIYGDPDPSSIPTKEDYRGLVSCTGPRACYDESKRLGETLCVNFARQYGCHVTIARPFNNYGPGLSIHDRRLLPDVARDIFEGRDIVQLSDGTATRTFCYIADAVSGYLKVLTHGEAGEPYNIGTERPEISVRDFVNKAAAIGAEQHGWRGNVVQQSSDDRHYLTDNPNRRCPDIGKARTRLGYEPYVGLDEGLKRALAWYSGNRE
ncbi:NAD-dependent epimerase/dehydratase family protein [Ramlibacter albus]|uniref:NAD-dependent epimerase/dehydratase family protein n=1 Tax=Ramlibacter albus TaxID=2079448 RepID=A0A923M6F1_9BURK|nr:NAD-dependent epimerase/dehydratase family protein [Ramlibacter albus]MBC5763631.1 NAD-dependent epimerase/dehydratase family protein [Ramlibacter albus]